MAQDIGYGGHHQREESKLNVMHRSKCWQQVTMDMVQINTQVGKL